MLFLSILLFVSFINPSLSLGSDNIPMGFPIDGEITSRFGWRQDPFNTSRRAFHTGIDIRAAPYTPVRVIEDGVVTYAGRKGGYGRTIIIDHGGYKSLYAHLAKIIVTPGCWVVRGTTIALSGSSGRSTGPHLHFEIRNKDNQPVDPIRFMRRRPEESEPVVASTISNEFDQMEKVKSRKEPRVEYEKTKRGVMWSVFRTLVLFGVVATILHCL